MDSSFYDLINENFGAFCTAIVSITALILSAFVTIYIQYRQAKIQERVTIKKEWVEKVRTYTASCVLNAGVYVSLINHYGTETRLLAIASTCDKDSYRNAFNQYHQNKESLAIYLDFNNKNGLEKQLYSLIEILIMHSQTGEVKRVEDHIKLIRVKIQEIVDAKLK